MSYSQLVPILIVIVKTFTTNLLSKLQFQTLKNYPGMTIITLAALLFTLALELSLTLELALMLLLLLLLFWMLLLMLTISVKRAATRFKNCQ